MKEVPLPEVKCFRCGAVFYLGGPADEEVLGADYISPEWVIERGWITRAVCPRCGADNGTSPP